MHFRRKSPFRNWRFAKNSEMCVSDTNEVRVFPKCAFPIQMTCAVFRKHVFRYKIIKKTKNYKKYKNYKTLRKLQKIQICFYTKRIPRQRYKKRIRNCKHDVLCTLSESSLPPLMSLALPRLHEPCQGDSLLRLVADPYALTSQELCPARQSLQFGTRCFPIRLLGPTEHLGRPMFFP